jgi:hypothetical protein
MEELIAQPRLSRAAPEGFRFFAVEMTVSMAERH